MSEGEDELRAAFDRAQRVRAVGGEAAALAEQWFLENMVRIHRAGEGAGYDGIKPAGSHVPAHRCVPPTRRWRRAASSRCAA